MKELSEESCYFLYLIEQYALHKGITGKQVLDLFEKQGIIEYIYGMYYTYHTERVENAIMDIDKNMRKPCPPTPAIKMFKVEGGI